MAKAMRPGPNATRARPVGLLWRVPYSPANIPVLQPPRCAAARRSADLDSSLIVRLDSRPGIVPEALLALERRARLHERRERPAYSTVRSPFMPAPRWGSQ